MFWGKVNECVKKDEEESLLTGKENDGDASDDIISASDNTTDFTVSSTLSSSSLTAALPSHQTTEASIPSSSSSFSSSSSSFVQFPHSVMPLSLLTPLTEQRPEQSALSPLSVSLSPSQQPHKPKHEMKRSQTSAFSTEVPCTPPKNRSPQTVPRRPKKRQKILEGDTTRRTRQRKIAWEEGGVTPSGMTSELSTSSHFPLFSPLSLTPSHSSPKPPLLLLSSPPPSPTSLIFTPPTSPSEFLFSREEKKYAPLSSEDLVSQLQYDLAYEKRKAYLLTQLKHIRKQLNHRVYPHQNSSLVVPLPIPHPGLQSSFSSPSRSAMILGTPPRVTDQISPTPPSSPIVPALPEMILSTPPRRRHRIHLLATPPSRAITVLPRPVPRHPGRKLNFDSALLPT